MAGIWQNHGPYVEWTVDDANHQVYFHFPEMDPENTASIGLRLRVDDPLVGVEGLAFTNTLAAPLPGDINAADNFDSVTAYTGPDVFVRKWLSAGEPAPAK